MSKIEETVIIVGAGLAGICASYYLLKNNIPHLILEKSSQIGGIWSSMCWPGIRCDTEIINYSYSFRPLASQQSLVSGKTISNYLKATSEDLGIIDKIRFDTEVIEARFCSAEKKWSIKTNGGYFKSQFIINANGYFRAKPYIPEFSGVDRFQGQVSHLFELSADPDLRGKSIVLIGSGASAISAAPALVKAGASLSLLQRSPSYIYEDSNRIGIFVNIAQKLLRVGFSFPIASVNFFLQLKSDLVFVLFRKAPWIGKIFFRHHWKTTVDSETYAEHFCPAYNPWEQRIPVATGLKRLIREKKIKLVTGRIDSFDESGIVLTDGRHISSDLCVLATGFNLNFFKFDIFVDNELVDSRGINFYKGMMMGGIPNYFQPFGPPHTSFTRRVETISKHIVKIMCYMHRHELDTVSIDRKKIAQVPRITPNYIMRNLEALPAIYGSLELPSIDNLCYYHFRPADYLFSGDAGTKTKTPAVRGYRASPSENRG